MGESRALLAVTLLSWKPGRAGPQAGQMSLVCGKHLPWKPETPKARATAKDSSRASSSKQGGGSQRSHQGTAFSPRRKLRFQQFLHWSNFRAKPLHTHDLPVLETVNAELRA